MWINVSKWEFSYSQVEIEISDLISIDRTINIIHLMNGSHYVCIDSQISLNVGLFFSNCQLSFRISNAQKLLDLKKLLALQ